MREQGTRCRLDGASRSDRQSIACVPNRDPSGTAHVPERLTRACAMPLQEAERVQLRRKATRLLQIRRPAPVVLFRNPRRLELEDVFTTIPTYSLDPTKWQEHYEGTLLRRTSLDGDWPSSERGNSCL